jgi:hypothetical protein
MRGWTWIRLRARDGVSLLDDAVGIPFGRSGLIWSSHPQEIRPRLEKCVYPKKLAQAKSWDDCSDISEPSPHKRGEFRYLRNPLSVLLPDGGKSFFSMEFQGVYWLHSKLQIVHPREFNKEGGHTIASISRGTLTPHP